MIEKYGIKMQTIIRSAIRTPDGTIIESRHRHDYNTHLDANGKWYMIDGGLDYVRSSANGDEVWIGTFLEDGHEKVREALTWGTRGKDGKSELKYIKLKDMETDHIVACLQTQSMLPQYKTAMKNELDYRLDNGEI